MALPLPPTTPRWCASISVIWLVTACGSGGLHSLEPTMLVSSYAASKLGYLTVLRATSGVVGRAEVTTRSRHLAAAARSSLPLPRGDVVQQIPSCL